MAMNIPAARPSNARFSSGPCTKIPTFSLDKLADAPLGRSHRAAVGKAKLKEAIEKTREILNIPAHYRIVILPASDTCAVEMAMVHVGRAPCDHDRLESFGAGWVTDVVKQLNDAYAPLITVKSLIWLWSITTRTLYSHGTAPHLACVCPMGMRSPQIVRG